MVDSCGTNNFQNIKNMFLRTPFDENKTNIIWKYLKGPKQALLSNDCGVFTTHVFAMYINFRKQQGSQHYLEDISHYNLSMNTLTFGKQGRAHLCHSLHKKQITFNDETIASMSICIESNSLESFVIQQVII